MKQLSVEEWVAIIISLIIAAVFLFGSTISGLLTSEANPALENTENMEDTNDNGLVITTTREGEGRAAVPGDLVVVNYRGRLAETGEEFDNSYDRGEPFAFPLGGGQVIAGWDQGLVGAKPGEARTLVIPAELGYGETGIPGVIPGGATLEFDVEVVDVIPADELNQ